MNLGQMLIVILSVVLFSTLIVAVYTNMTNHMQMATQTTYQNQSIQVANACFDKLEAEYLGQVREFQSLLDDFDDSANQSFTAPYQLDGSNDAVIVNGVSYTPYLWSQDITSNTTRITCRVRVNTSPTEFFWLGGTDDFNKDFSDDV